MKQFAYLLPFLVLSACVVSQAESSVAGTYELIEGGTFNLMNEYDVYTISEGQIAYRSGRSGQGHHSWRGFYLRQDSLMEVFTYFSLYQDGNVGFTTADTRQWRSRLTIRENDGQPLLVRKNPPSPIGTFPNISFSPPAMEVYTKISDSIKFYPPPVTDCLLYGNSRMQYSHFQKTGADSTQMAEQMLYDLLTDHLNSLLETVTFDPASRKRKAATVLLKLNPSPEFPLPEITVVDNSTPYSKEQIMTSFQSFKAKRIRAFNSPHLQDYLLVVMTVNEDGICVLPPYRRGFFNLHR